MLAMVLLAAAVIGLATALLALGIGWRRAAPIGLFAWTLVCLLVITIVPTSGGRSGLPIATTCSFDYGGPAPDGFWIVPGGQRLLNAVAFVPAGLLMVISCAQFRRGLRWVVPGVLLLAGTSVMIEWTQLVTRWGRACDITDIADNTLGALVGTGIGLAGVGIVRGVSRMVRRPARELG